MARPYRTVSVLTALSIGLLLQLASPIAASTAVDPSVTSKPTTTHSSRHDTPRKRRTRHHVPNSHDAAYLPVSSSTDTYQVDAMTLLADAVRPLWDSAGQDDAPSTPPPPPSQLLQALQSLRRAHQTLQSLDGLSHEAYQRTHATQTINGSVRGRARRSQARASASANALFACELCELAVEYKETYGRSSMKEEDECTPEEVALREQAAKAVLEGRTVLVHSRGDIALQSESGEPVALKVLILYEPNYRGGAGLYHGGIEAVAPHHQVEGRFLVILADSAADDLQATLQMLYMDPVPVPLQPKEDQSEQSSPKTAYVHPQMYQAAGQVLERLRPHWNQTDGSAGMAIHFVGRSLAGGVASIAATIFDGGLPMPKTESKGKRRRKRSTHQLQQALDVPKSEETCSGLARGKTSAVTLGAPPCLSANVPTQCVTSILFGDDVVCRTTKQGMNRLLKRVRKACERGQGGVLGKQLSRWTDTVALAATSLQKQASFSSSLSKDLLHVPGRAFLIRPRRLENHCSIHEVGQYMKQKREALRAAVLWQLNDVLLSKSMWKHHSLDSYIHGLDRVHLRGFDSDAKEEAEMKEASRSTVRDRKEASLMEARDNETSDYEDEEEKEEEKEEEEEEEEDVE